MVIYTDEESFAFMTPEGHVFAGWVTFSAFEENNSTKVQVQVLMRSPYPIIEPGLRMGGHKAEDKIWFETLENLTKHLEVEAVTESNTVCIDKKIQWRAIRNLRHNGIIGSNVYTFLAPYRWLLATRSTKGAKS